MIRNGYAVEEILRVFGCNCAQTVHYSERVLSVYFKEEYVML